MWRDVGVVREGKRLATALGCLEELRSALAPAGSRRSWEAANILQTATLIARAALARRESRGAHYRTDLPFHDDEHFLKHSVIEREKISFK